MKSQLKTIANTVKGAKEHIASYSEMAIDIFIDEETLKNIPIVEHAIKILNIRDVYKKNKIKRNYLCFIESVSKLSDSETEAFSTTLFNGDALGEDATETLFEIIAEGEKPIRASIAGNLVCALAKGKISLKTYNDLLLIAHSGSILALKSIPEATKTMAHFGEWDHPFGSPEEPLLISLGIVKKQGRIIMLSKLGKQFFIHGYNINENQ